MYMCHFQTRTDHHTKKQGKRKMWSRIKGRHLNELLAILCGICQFSFLLDVLTMMVLTLKERHRAKTTIAVFCAM